MLFYIENRKVVHFEYCYHLKRSKKDKLQCFATLAKAREQGFRICKCCDPVMKTFLCEEKELIPFCKENRIICFAQDSTVHIQTAYSKWKVISTNEGKLAVYHKNTKFKKGNIHSSVVGYHLQNVSCEKILSVCKYILEHDEYRYHTNESNQRKTDFVKGSRKWRAEQDRIKKQKRRNAIKNVYFIFDQLAAEKIYG